VQIQCTTPPETAGADVSELAPGLTVKQDRMAQHLFAHGSPLAAYVHAYEPKTTNRRSLRNTAFRLANHPKVRARLAVLQAAAADRCVTTNADLMAALEELVEVDPNELVAVVVSCCRYCHGAHHERQWSTPDEYALACAKAIDRGERPPTDAGGYGFTLDREAHGDCPQCHGAGDARVHFSSTAEASRGARRLLRGVELYPDGRLKRLHLHDQTALRVELHKLRGMVVDRSASVVAHVNVPNLADIAADPEKALEYIASLRPAAKATQTPVTIEATAEPAP
jgi:hypothetical protein